MKATGIVRKVDPLGRIVLPKSLRTTLKMDVDDPIEIYMEGECIHMKRFEPICVFCGETGKLTAFKEKGICKKCLDAVKRR
ncbi:MAG: AbrB/MazE/SpoVT family DNA-binding domain-containing protein [Eubacteriales bacterium]|nr:AbrB/MazE/SpoVT family DNA-binding domain-containing protein [Eubacteriales bacterium]